MCNWILLHLIFGHMKITSNISSQRMCWKERYSWWNVALYAKSLEKSKAAHLCDESLKTHLTLLIPFDQMCHLPPQEKLWQLLWKPAIVLLTFSKSRRRWRQETNKYEHVLDPNKGFEPVRYCLGSWSNSGPGSRISYKPEWDFDDLDSLPCFTMSHEREVATGMATSESTQRDPVWLGGKNAREPSRKRDQCVGGAAHQRVCTAYQAVSSCWALWDSSSVDVHAGDGFAS